MECFFWDFEKEIWSPTKCQLIPHDSNRINTVCKCYNATNFAALVDRKDRIDIELMTSLSCGLSTISLLSTLILILSKTLNNNQSINMEKTLKIRNIIICNICFLLLVVNVLLIFETHKSDTTNKVENMLIFNFYELIQKFSYHFSGCVAHFQYYYSIYY